jgi:hypothetical protein
MRTDLETLKQVVIEAAKKSPVAEKLEGVELESAHYDETGDFLRVKIRLKGIDEADRPTLIKLIESIEDAVGELDDRYPSVRFPDAA